MSEVEWLIFVAGCILFAGVIMRDTGPPRVLAWAFDQCCRPFRWADRRGTYAQGGEVRPPGRRDARAFIIDEDRVGEVHPAHIERTDDFPPTMRKVRRPTRRHQGS